MKFPEVTAPADTCTDAGTVATDGLPLESVTVAPLAGAGASRVTVLEVRGAAPPTADAEARLTEATVSGFKVSTAFTFAPGTLAVIVTGVVAPTELVVMVNDAEEAFAGTITLEGTPAKFGFELESVTFTPPADAGLPRLTTFEVVDSPPTTLAGVRTSELIGGGSKVRLA